VHEVGINADLVQYVVQPCALFQVGIDATALLHDNQRAPGRH
jgi:hypothetical protein